MSRTADEVTHVVSLLPGGVPLKAQEDANYLDASADGTGIAFSVGNRLYLRLGNEITYEIGENVTLADVSKHGGSVLYLKAGDLYAFDTGSAEVIRFTQTGDARVVNVAPDRSRPTSSPLPRSPVQDLIPTAPRRKPASPTSTSLNRGRPVSSASSPAATWKGN